SIRRLLLNLPAAARRCVMECFRVLPLLILAALVGCRKPADVPAPPPPAPPGAAAEIPAPSAPASADAEQEATPPAAPLAATPLTLRQRSTTAIPGSDGRLSLTIDDIT